MGQNFDDYPDFQPKITHPKHFSRQCSYSLLHRTQTKDCELYKCTGYYAQWGKNYIEVCFTIIIFIQIN